MKECNYNEVEFPQIARFVRHSNRIYFITDFEDGEILTYYGRVEKPSSNAKGYRLYLGKNQIRMVHFNDIEEVKGAE